MAAAANFFAWQIPVFYATVAQLQSRTDLDCFHLKATQIYGEQNVTLTHVHMDCFFLNHTLLLYPVWPNVHLEITQPSRTNLLLCCILYFGPEIWSVYFA